MEHALEAQVHDAPGWRPRPRRRRGDTARLEVSQRSASARGARGSSLSSVQASSRCGRTEAAHLLDDDVYFLGHEPAGLAADHVFRWTSLLPSLRLLFDLAPGGPARPAAAAWPPPEGEVWHDSALPRECGLGMPLACRSASSLAKNCMRPTNGWSTPTPRRGDAERGPPVLPPVRSRWPHTRDDGWCPPVAHEAATRAGSRRQAATLPVP